MPIDNLSGIERLSNPATLLLEMNYRLGNASPLAGLTNPRYLGIASIGVTDPAPLLDPPALTRLAWRSRTRTNASPCPEWRCAGRQRCW